MDNVTEPLVTKTMQASVTDDVELLMGSAYNFVVNVTPDAIEKGATSFEVEHIDFWDGNPNTNEDVFTDYEKLKIASKLGGKVILQNNVPGEGETVEPITVVDDLTILSADPVTNPDGYKITYSGNKGYLFDVVNKNTATNNGDNKTTLTIGGPVTVGNSEVNSVVSISANGGIATTGPNTEIIINGGKHISGSSTLYKSTGGKIQIIDGEFESASTFTPELLKGNTDNISISGGAFCGWDPSNTPDNQNYLALTGETTSTYVAIPNKPEPGWYFVTKRQTVTNQGNGSKENLNDAFKDPEVTIIDVTTNVDYNESFGLENRGELTINMNGNTFTGNTTAEKPGGFSGAVVYDCQLTINDANILESIQVGFSKARLILNNCNISITSLNTADRYCIFATTNSETIYNGGTLSLVPSDGSTKKRHYFYVEYGAKIYVIDCTCGAQMSTYSPVSYGPSGGTVMIYSGSFGFDPRNWATIAPGSQVKEDGSTYIVTHPCIDAPSKPDGKKGAKRITAGEYTYPFDPTQWLENGCEAIKNSDGTWKVSHSSK